jgi:hypothetical protein
MNWLAISALTGVAAVLLTAFTTAVVWLFRHIIPTIRKLSRMGDRVFGIPEDTATGQKHVPGLFEVLDGITHELHPNSGKSLRDAVDQVAQKQDDQGKKLDDHIASCQSGAVTTTVTVNSSGDGTQ